MSPWYVPDCRRGSVGVNDRFRRRQAVARGDNGERDAARALMQAERSSPKAAASGNKPPPSPAPSASPAPASPAAMNSPKSPKKELPAYTKEQAREDFRRERAASGAKPAAGAAAGRGRGRLGVATPQAKPHFDEGWG